MNLSLKYVTFSILSISFLIIIQTFIFKVHPIGQLLLIFVYVLVDAILYFFLLAKAQRIIDLNRFQGIGTRDNPIKIEKIESDHHFPMIIGLKKYSIIQNIETAYLEINKSEGIDVKNSKFEFLIIQNSNNLSLSNIRVSDTLFIHKTSNLSIYSSEVNTLHLKRTDLIKIKNCSIITIKKELYNKDLVIIDNGNKQFI